MTSEIDNLKTNEFLRRRKLRLQQVREQSKDIAKKIRQRAKVETIRQVVDLDAKKQKEYFDRQEKLVKRLEVLYARGINNVGASHQSASELTQDAVTKTDLSKVRGREAAAELRKKRQEKLDEQKKLLDRKLQARENANVISREKSTTVSNKLTKAGSSKSEDTTQKHCEPSIDLNPPPPNSNKDAPEPLTRNDMATQCETEIVTNEYEPIVPALVLPKDDQASSNPDLPPEDQASKSDKSKRLDLFAVSKEMPTDLYVQHVQVSDRKDMTRPSLTLVSEYLQTRKLRLREMEPTSVPKKYDDISSLKETILRTRNSKEGKGTSCSENLKAGPILNKKSSVTMYNHNTRDIQDLPCKEQIVVRDQQTQEDAYSLAQKESSQIHLKERDHEKKVQNMRNKVAVTKQTVEKEYKDTIKFLNSLPKEGNKVTKTAYMDERRQQMHNENRQHRMQQEYRKIEKECHRQHHSCMKKSKKPVSPPKQDIDEDFDAKDFQYSWMPVPEGDGNLAIHTIPNSVKKGKSGNSVKFNKVESYHEYRSRHKHTPPTKDIGHHEKIIEPVNEISGQSTDDSSVASDTSSVENLKLHKTDKRNKNTDPNASDAERIIIYKILDTRREKHSKKKNKILNDIAKSLTSIEQVQKSAMDDKAETTVRNNRKQTSNADDINFEHVNEGVYKVVEEKKDNIATTFLSNDDPESLINHAEGSDNHCKNRNKNQPKGPVPEWDCAHIPQTERTAKSCTCREGCKGKTARCASPSRKQGQASSTASSFKSASHENPISPTDGNFIKLVDEAGLEAGKFFIGNTGILKDSAYEVVIQLRKKDNSKDEKESTLVLPEQKEPTASKLCGKVNTEITESVHYVTSESDTNIPITVANNVILNLNESKQTSPRNFEANKLATNIVTHKEVANGTENKEDKGIPISTNNEYNKKIVEDKKNLVDKSTITIQNDPISEPPSRPATTACTQTSSPIHRPVYIHMSSSTSTAYMSPPDMILPNFLRHDSRLTDYETCEVKSAPTEKNKKCRHARKAFSKGDIKTTGCKINKHQSTPPNSLTSIYKNSDKDSTCSKRSKRDICKCNNCCCSARDQMQKLCSKKKQSAPGSYRSSQNFNLINNMKGSIKNKHLTARQDKSRGYLNPVVKSYINKLLALNREGLKAIEVADQECSSVGTPSSSIINVPYNIDESKPLKGNRISLEHVKQTFMQQIIHKHMNSYFNEPIIPHMFASPSKKHLPKKPRRKSVHKVKSLNISKHVLKKHKSEEFKSTNHVSVSTTTDDYNKSSASSKPTRSRPRSSPSSSQKQQGKSIPTMKPFTKTEVTPTKKTKNIDTQQSRKADVGHHFRKQYISQKTTDTSHGTESTIDSHNGYNHKCEIPISMSTQTSQNLDNDFMKLAEDKLHNMEKIADLTEKCTKRLSNLAKVLEEVRKNKSLVYSQISSSDSADYHSDHKSDKGVKTPVPIDSGDVPQLFELKSPEPVAEKKSIPVTDTEESLPEFISFLSDIPKPAASQISEFNLINSTPSHAANIIRPVPVTPKTNPHSPQAVAPELMKFRPKPPPALSRIHLKYGQEDIVPHELSTVIEVDSPMSIKNKTSSRRCDPSNSNRSSNEDKEPNQNNKENENSNEKHAVVNPDLLQNNSKMCKQPKSTSAEFSDDSNFQMIDLKHFNEIMLEPFISINEYAKKYNVEATEEMSNVEDLHKEEAGNDDISSLHSDGSLPDVIAELLKRNIITEPFKFDTASNINSTTISSESTLSMLALSKARKTKKRPHVVFRNKENIGETSDTLSISSNPDLESAFKKLGMGWASSTLKKTKERLALSSSSNTSSSSISHLKLKSFHHDIPVLVTDSVSSVLLSKKEAEANNVTENSRDGKHQKKFPDSMTVNEFLTNELANKITFTNNKTGINDTEEFVSLFETKMPEGINQQTLINCEQCSNDSARSGVNRARTSTPVQIFKSMTYHSSSGSNTSNGLFSNADDLSSVKMTSNSMKNHSTSDREDLTIPNFSLKMKKGIDSSKSD